MYMAYCTKCSLKVWIPDIQVALVLTLRLADDCCETSMMRRRTRSTISHLLTNECEHIVALAIQRVLTFLFQVISCRGCVVRGVRAYTTRGILAGILGWGQGIPRSEGVPAFVFPTVTGIHDREEFVLGRDVRDYWQGKISIVWFRITAFSMCLRLRPWRYGFRSMVVVRLSGVT